jgi:hypothetical protein
MQLRAITTLLLLSASAWAQEAEWKNLLATEPTPVESGLRSGEWHFGPEGVVGKTVDGEAAVLRIPGEFWDFELSFEFFAPEPASGGIQFRSHWLPVMPATQGNASPPNRIYGYEAHIDTRAGGRSGYISDADGQDILSADSEEYAGALGGSKWNTMRISAIGPVSEVAINGVVSARISEERFIGGFVALTVDPREGGKPGEIRFRNLRVRDLGRGGTWRPLFDGASLRGWKNWGTEEFSAADGVIRARRGFEESEGYLATEERWTDFHVRGEFRMLGDGNYGLFYHSSIHLRDDGYPIITGVQGEVMPRRPAETGRLYESYGRGWLTPKDRDDVGSWALREGRWNAFEIRSLGDRVTTWVNGIRVVDFLDASPVLLEGSFALQLHAGEGAGIDWRELYVLDD